MTKQRTCCVGAPGAAQQQYHPPKRQTSPSFDEMQTDHQTLCWKLQKDFLKAAPGAPLQQHVNLSEESCLN